MEYGQGQFLPQVDQEKCIECGLCLELCPGIDINPFLPKYDKVTPDAFDGPCLESYTAYSRDARIRENSVSGGLITALITELIRTKEFDAAFVLSFNNFDGSAARLRATNNIEEMFNAAKSKYVPASVYEVVKNLEKGENKRYIIVGTPCLLYGLKKYVKHKKLSEENLLFLGLFCDGTLNFNIIRYLEEIYRKSNESLSKLEYRTKEKYGWPGNVKLSFDSGRELIVNKKVRMGLKKYFQLNRCLLCVNKLNTSADIAFGDCYIKSRANRLGKSSVIVRTENGREVLRRYSHLFTFEKEHISRIRKSQHLVGKKDNLEYARILAKESNLCGDIPSNYKVSQKAEKELSKLQKRIRWGQNCNFNRIRFSYLLNRAVKTLSNIKQALIIAAAFITLTAKAALRTVVRGRKKAKVDSWKGQNIIILGGQLFNKGAQAMTFTVVDQMRRMFVDSDIYLFSANDFDRPDEEKSLYTFKFLPYDLRTKLQVSGNFSNLLSRYNKYGYLAGQIREVVKNAKFFVDISGYALSSQMSLLVSVKYLLNIMIAENSSVPFYIFPQSIGPFNYPFVYKIFLYPLMKLCLRYPQQIFVREEQGLNCVKKFTRKNVKKSFDIVLQARDYNLSNIYAQQMQFRNIAIKPDSVGIIPNAMRVVERNRVDKIYLVYKRLIDRLIEAQKTVYIIRHAYEDLQICEDIKGLFPSADNVILIADEFSAIELKNIVKQFDFVIASRYHALVYSFKNAIPTIVIGWAEKYRELLSEFGQLDYLFDVRDEIDIDNTIKALERMMLNYKNEKEKIAEKMKTVGKENIFELFIRPQLQVTS